MAEEKIVYKKEYVGIDTERTAMSKVGIVPGSTFYCYDTKITYIFAKGDWRAL